MFEGSRMQEKGTNRQTELPWHIRAIAYNAVARENSRSNKVSRGDTICTRVQPRSARNREIGLTCDIFVTLFFSQVFSFFTTTTATFGE